jgi:hypothetical protein
MRIEKKTLNDALRVLGKVVCQTSPVELYRSVRFVGDVDGVMAMATDLILFWISRQHSMRIFFCKARTISACAAVQDLPLERPP